MKGILIGIFVGIMNLCYSVIKLVPTRHKVTMLSRQGNDPSLDFLLLKEALLERDPELEVVFLCQEMEKSIPGMIRYLGHLFRQMVNIAQSEFIVLDSYCISASILRHKKGLEVFQMWHALGAIKRFGYQTVGQKTGSDPVVTKAMHMHRNYDYIACASDATARFFMEAFGYGPEHIAKLGIPRIDYILRDDPAMKEAIFRRYPQMAGGKINVLYAPTFRKGSATNPEDLIRHMDFSRYTLVIRLHFLDGNAGKLEDRDGVVIADEFDTYDILKACDVVISDYSSFVIESSLLDKPIYLYTYDLEEYRRETGLNVDYTEEPIGRYQFQKAAELCEAMDQPYDHGPRQALRDKYVDVDTEDCAGKMAEFLLNRDDRKQPEI